MDEQHEPPAGPPPATEQPRPAPRALRSRWWLWIVIPLGVLIALGLVGQLTRSTGGQSDPNVDASLSGNVAKQVGGRDDIIVTVTNKGPDIEDLSLLMNEGQDRWFDHEVVISTGRCTADAHRALPGVTCGRLTKGATMTVEIVASPKDAGNFKYAIGIMDEPTNGGLRQWSQVLTFSQTVRPS
jgi:hypothetical protein